jgi:circadian clock protein KaiB
MNNSAEIPDNDFWTLRLYVNGFKPPTIDMVEKLRAICAGSLGKNYSLEVVDMATHPELGAADRVLALPTLVRKLPVPLRKIIGDLSNPERVRVALNLPAPRIAA